MFNTNNIICLTILDDFIDYGNVSSGLYVNDSSEFQCVNGEIIKYMNKCDNKFDCSDKSDETDCWKDCKYTSAIFVANLQLLKYI